MSFSDLRDSHAQFMAQHFHGEKVRYLSVLSGQKDPDHRPVVEVDATIDRDVQLVDVTGGVVVTVCVAGLPTWLTHPVESKDYLECRPSSGRGWRRRQVLQVRYRSLHTWELVCK